MTFYKDKISRSILYVTPEGTGYTIGVYGEEYPDGRVETVTGTVDRVSNSKKERYIKSAETTGSSESGEINKEDVPQNVIETLQRKLSDRNAP